MKTRIITALVFAVVGIPILIFSNSDYFVFPIAVALMSLLSVIEMLRVCGVNKARLISIPSYVMAVVLPLLAWDKFSFIHVDIFGGEYCLSYISLIAIVFFVYLLYMAFAAVFERGKLDIREIAIAFMTVFYLIVSFSSYTLIRYNGDYGKYLFIMVLLVAWGADISAYFVGTLCGKHKLIPEVSPKKTVEGAVGGVVIAAGLTMLFGFIVTLIDDGVKANYLALAIYGLVFSCISQLGDLWASIIKRQYGVKDYGSLFPGHGGVMDRFDSVISICTLMMLASLIFPPFTAA